MYHIYIYFFFYSSKGQNQNGSTSLRYLQRDGVDTHESILAVHHTSRGQECDHQRSFFYIFKFFFIVLLYLPLYRARGIYHLNIQSKSLIFNVDPNIFTYLCSFSLLNHIEQYWVIKYFQSKSIRWNILNILNIFNINNVIVFSFVRISFGSAV